MTQVNIPKGKFEMNDEENDRDEDEESISAF